ncbi:MAG: hypothetical protein WA820_23245, partial [Bradyrhizobium sp.]
MGRLQADEYCITPETISQINVGYRFDAQWAPRDSRSPSRGEADDNTINAAGALDDCSPAISGRSWAETASQGFLSLDASSDGLRLAEVVR